MNLLILLITLILPDALLAKRTKIEWGNHVTFIPWRLRPNFSREYDRHVCGRGMTIPFYNSESIPQRRINVDKCHSEKQPFEAFVYGLEDDFEMMGTHSAQFLHKTCDLLFYDRKGCKGTLVWAFEDVNREKYCQIMDGKLAISVKLSCREKGAKGLPPWRDDLEPAIPDVTYIEVGPDNGDDIGDDENESY